MEAIAGLAFWLSEVCTGRISMGWLALVSLLHDRATSHSEWSMRFNR